MTATIVATGFIIRMPCKYELNEVTHWRYQEDISFDFYTKKFVRVCDICLLFAFLSDLNRIYQFAQMWLISIIHRRLNKQGYWNSFEIEFEFHYLNFLRIKQTNVEIIFNFSAFLESHLIFCKKPAHSVLLTGNYLIAKRRFPATLRGWTSMNYEDHNANGACAFAAHKWFDLVTLPWLAQLFYRWHP